MDNYNKMWSLIRNTDLLNCDEKNELHLYLIDLKKQREIIDKAIEYIRKNMEQRLYTGEQYLKTYDCCTDLLQILEDKEV